MRPVALPGRCRCPPSNVSLARPKPVVAPAAAAASVSVGVPSPEPETQSKRPQRSLHTGRFRPTPPRPVRVVGLRALEGRGQATIYVMHRKEGLHGRSCVDARTGGTAAM